MRQVLCFFNLNYHFCDALINLLKVTFFFFLSISECNLEYIVIPLLVGEIYTLFTTLDLGNVVFLYGCDVYIKGVLCPILIS